MAIDERAAFELQRTTMGWDYKELARWLRSSQAGEVHAKWADEQHAKQVESRKEAPPVKRETPEPPSLNVRKTERR